MPPGTTGHAMAADDEKTAPPNDISQPPPHDDSISIEKSDCGISEVRSSFASQHVQ